MLMASLKIPSPNNTEYNCGNQLSLTIFNTATVSVAQITAESNKVSDILNYLSCNIPDEFSKTLRQDIIINDKTVPKMP